MWQPSKCGICSYHQCSHCNLAGETIQEQPSAGGAMLAQGGCTSTWEEMPMVWVFYQSSMASHYCLFYGAHNMDQLIHLLTSTVQRHAFPKLLRKTCTLSSHLTSSNKRLFHIFYNQLVAITASLWHDKGLHCHGSVIVSCSLVRLSDHLPSPLFTEVLAQMNFPVCNWVRHQLNHMNSDI